MQSIKSIITGFAKCKESPNHFVVFTTIYQQDEFTGLASSVKRTYICVNSHYFKDLIHKECILDIEKSVKLNKDVCVGIRLCSEKGE